MTPPNPDPLEAIDKIVNGMISSRLFEVKADAEMWQVEIVQQISEAAKQRMLSILQQEKKEAERLGRIDGRRIQAEASADKYTWYTEEGIATEFETFLKAQVEVWRYEQAELESARNKDA